MKPLSPDAIPRGLSGYMMVIEEPMDEAEKWLITIEAHCSVLDDIPANKELTDAIRSNVVEVRQALAAKDTEIAGLRLLIRGEQTKPPFDVADDPPSPQTWPRGARRLSGWRGKLSAWKRCVRFIGLS
jgi:hypothetical protein